MSYPLPQNHQEWLLRFERAVAESPAAQSTPASGDSEVEKLDLFFPSFSSSFHSFSPALMIFTSYQALSEKLREAEEAQQVLQKDCETYKKVLAETVKPVFDKIYI